MIRKMVAIVALVLIASLLVTGYISSIPTPSPTSSQTQTSGGHNAVLEKFVAKMRKGNAENPG